MAGRLSITAFCLSIPHPLQQPAGLLVDGKGVRLPITTQLSIPQPFYQPAGSLIVVGARGDINSDTNFIPQPSYQPAVVDGYRMGWLSITV
jgi:hypothetical protein